MIAIEHKPVGVLASVVGEFTLADYREFEENVLYEVKFHGQPNLLFDLTDMLGYTVDLVWEELRFSRTHGHHFGRVAVVTRDEWVTWATWVSRLFIDSEVRVFDDGAQAEAWLCESIAVID
ncbi:STAS/SEC14 domain-containing protein [Chitinimonas sp. PSY-7]|uniref:STAS/SEC14 domain-containing protein n=1 Tax=Chitinimonas sp. PSY-7 TaxID=3459088 RepID=UPI00403FFF5B